jgi:hypothetical protein
LYDDIENVGVLEDGMLNWWKHWMMGNVEIFLCRLRKLVELKACDEIIKGKSAEKNKKQLLYF